MNESDYFSLMGVSSHTLIELIQYSPLHCWARYFAKDRERSSSTPAMTLGRAIHCLILTPDLFQNEFVVSDWDNRTKAGRERTQQMESLGVTLLKQEDMILAERIANAVLMHPIANGLLKDGYPEKTIHIERGNGLLPMKGRLDYLNGQVVEIKTTVDASPTAFGYQVRRFLYHLQAAFYCHLSGREQHTFIVVEKKPPFAVAVYESSPSLLQAGKELWQSALEKFDECWAAQQWPGYEGIKPLELSVSSVGRGIDSPVGELAL